MTRVQRKTWRQRALSSSQVWHPPNHILSLLSKNWCVFFILWEIHVSDTIFNRTIMIMQPILYLTLTSAFTCKKKRKEKKWRGATWGYCGDRVGADPLFKRLHLHFHKRVFACVYVCMCSDPWCGGHGDDRPPVPESPNGLLLDSPDSRHIRWSLHRVLETRSSSMITTTPPHSSPTQP